MDFSKFWWTSPEDGPLPPTDSIPNSLRFRGSQNLQGTFFDDSGSHWTFSAWVKPTGTNISNDRVIFSTETPLQLNFLRNESFGWTQASVADTEIAKRRDPNAWYHVVWVGTGDGQDLYVNGEHTRRWDTPSVGINTAVVHEIGGQTIRSSEFFEGYMADVYFIDGRPLLPTAFGRYNELGVWVPRKVDFAPTEVTYSDTVYLSQPTVGIDLSTTVPLPEPTSAKYSFDGDLNTMGNSTQPNSGWVWRPKSPIVAQNSFRIHLNNLAPNGADYPVQSIYLNDTNFPIIPEQAYTEDQWVDIPGTYPLTIEALGMKGGGTNWAGGYIGAIEVDGEILLDPDLWSDQVTLIGAGSEGGFAPHQAPTNMFDGKTNTYCISQASNQSIKWVPNEPIHYKDSVAIWTPSAAGSNNLYLYYEGQEVAVVVCLESQWTYLTREAGAFDDLRIYGVSTDARVAAVMIDGVIIVDGQAIDGYGKNGFHLTFEDPNNLGKDYSGAGNDFQAIGFNVSPPVFYSEYLYTAPPADTP